MKFIELCCLCSAVCRCRLLRRCSRWLISSRRSRSRGFFGVKSSPVRIYSRSLNSAFLCLLFCSICIRNRLKFTDSKHCFADDVWTSQLFMNTLVIDANRFQSNVICCLETKNASWRQTTVWRYSAHHWIDERCEFSSLGTMRGPRTEGDAIINSLRSALCAVINLAFASGHFTRNYSIHSRGLSWTHHNGSLPFIWVTTVLKRRIKLISQRRLNQKGDKGVRGWVSLHSERNCDTALNSFLWRGRWRGKIWNIKLTAHADPNIFKPGM